MSERNDRFSLAIIGGGSAAEELLRQLEGSDERVVVFEPELMGGECPFLACMPSKSMLHDSVLGRDWDEAVQRRDEITSHRDDSEHADTARALGATLVRAHARIAGIGRVVADGVEYEVERIVIATGASPTFPPIEGLDTDHQRIWTSRDALTTTQRPESVLVIGGGVIGTELAFMFAGFGCVVTTMDTVDRPAGDLHPRVGELIDEVVTDAGVTSLYGVVPERIVADDEGVTVRLEGGSEHRGDVVIVATGRTPSLSSIGLETVGIDPDDPDGGIEVDDAGRLVGADGVWIAGDAAGLDQYTHAANHHATVIADHLVGDGTRRYDDVVMPACIFIDPPVMVVGPTWADLDGDDDVVWAEVDVDTARSLTDEHPAGFLAVAARRSTGCVVAAHGIGPRLDEVVHALVVAIDGEVPVARLAQMIQPFPTVGEVLHQAFTDLAAQLTTRLAP